MLLTIRNVTQEVLTECHKALCILTTQYCACDSGASCLENDSIVQWWRVHWVRCTMAFMS